MLKNPSLKTRITIAVLILLAVVALLVTLVSVAVMKQKVRQLIEEQQSVLLTTTAQDIDRRISLRSLQEDNLIAQVVRTKVGKTGYFSIMRTDGTVVADRESARMPTPAAKTLSVAEKKALAGFEGTLADTDRSGTRGLYSFKRLSAAPWILVAFYPEAEAFSVVSDLQHSVLLVAL